MNRRKPAPGSGRDPHIEMAWSDLLPAGWEPKAVLHALGIDKVEALDDADPRMMALMRRWRLAWDQAPVNASLAGQQISLAGFLAPLAQDAAGVHEGLLVPHHGSCIHAPPPPANQVVRLVLAKPASGFRTMDAVWARGVLRTRRASSSLGVAGYRLEATLLVHCAVGPR